MVRKPKTGTNSTLSLTLWSTHFLFSSLSLRPRHPRRPFFCLLPTFTKRALLIPLSIPPTTKSPMFLTSLAFLLGASASALAQSQIVYDSAHNVTPITGTWSSGSMNVVTGAVRMFVHLPWHLLITGIWSSNTFSLTTKASHTPKLQVFHLHCASASLFFFYRGPKILRNLFFFFSNEAVGWFEVLRYRMNGNGASFASLRP